MNFSIFFPLRVLAPTSPKSHLAVHHSYRTFFSQVAEDPYALAFDWNARNLYIANKISQTIEVVRTAGTTVRVDLWSLKLIIDPSSLIFDLCSLVFGL